MKKYSGFTAGTAQKLLLNAGAFFKNFTPGTDTFDSAVAGGKLIGATKGGGEFSAVPEVRQVEVDGVSGRTKGLEMIDSWEVYLKATVLEVSEEVLKLALGAGQSETSTVSNYKEITAKENIELSDYISNITWVGTLSGSNDPVIIQVYNALHTDGLKLTTQDKNESSVELTFYGHYAEGTLDEAPFDIFYPTTVTTATT